MSRFTCIPADKPDAAHQGDEQEPPVLRTRHQERGEEDEEGGEEQTYEEGQEVEEEEEEEPCEETPEEEEVKVEWPTGVPQASDKDLAKLSNTEGVRTHDTNTITNRQSYRTGMNILSVLSLISSVFTACCTSRLQKERLCVSRSYSDTPTNDLCGLLGEIIAYSSIFQKPPPMSAGVFWHLGCPPGQMTEPLPEARVLSWRGRASSWRWRWNQSYTKNNQNRLKASGSWLLYNPVEV